MALFLIGGLVAALRVKVSNAFRGHSGAWSVRGGRAASGLALLIPHCSGAGQAYGMAYRGNFVITQMGECVLIAHPSDGGGDPRP